MFVKDPTTSNEGHFATFRGGQGGPTYTDVGAAIFEDQCYRHLVGDWWMFAPESKGAGARLGIGPEVVADTQQPQPPEAGAADGESIAARRS
jgi:hypothetical protein